MSDCALVMIIGLILVLKFFWLVVVEGSVVVLVATFVGFRCRITTAYDGFYSCMTCGLLLSMISASVCHTVCHVASLGFDVQRQLKVIEVTLGVKTPGGSRNIALDKDSPDHYDKGGVNWGKI